MVTGAYIAVILTFRLYRDLLYTNKPCIGCYAMNCLYKQEV